ncbi:MAG TPA: hypothetical protein VGM33_24645 [Baekduia sp.]
MSAFEVTIHPRRRPTTAGSLDDAAMSSIPGPAMSSIPQGPAMSSIPAPSGSVRELSPLSGRR